MNFSKVVDTVLKMFYHNFCHAMLCISADCAVMRCLCVFLSRSFYHNFCHAMLCISADCAIMRCLCVFLSRSWILSKRVIVLSDFFHCLVFSHQTGWRYSDGDPLTGASNARGMKKSQFLTNISLYLWTDARYGHSCYRGWIGNCTQAFEWYQFEWSWVICNPDFKVVILFNVK